MSKSRSNGFQHCLTGTGNEVGGLPPAIPTARPRRLAPIYTRREKHQVIELIHEDRLTQLRALLEYLAACIDELPGARDLASLSKQYRETLAEIEELESKENDGDEISEILQDRKDSGRAGAVRKNRTAI